jgi:exonuclease III
MKHLKICSFNIQGGLERKFEFHDVCSLIDQYHLVCIQETWLVDSSYLKVKGYGIFRSDRGSHKKKQTGSGGVVVLYRSELTKGLKKISSKLKDILWIRLDKHFFKLENDVYIANCYLPPEDSVIHKDLEGDVFDILNEEISKYSKRGEVILCGDFNARSGNIQEKLLESQENFHFDDVINITGDSVPSELTPRCNSDKTINNFGKKLVDLVETFGLYILNGRTLGDTKGEKTCYTSRGSSTVDYFVASLELCKLINYMKVRPQTWYSDHSPIEMCLSVGLDIQRNSIVNSVKKDKLIWDENGINRYNLCMNSDETKYELNQLAQCGTVDEILGKLVQIIKKVVNDNVTKKSGNTNEKKVYDNKEIRDAKKSFNSAWRLYRQDTSDPQRYRNFITNRRKYKQMKYLFFKYKKEDKLHKLAKIEAQNPKLFWKTIRSFTKTRAEMPNITSNQWVSHFEHLLNVQSTDDSAVDSSFLNYVENSLPILEREMSQGLLDYEINDKELETAIRKLKNNKSMGPDNISNEMLKYGGRSLHLALKHLFNQIIRCASYPQNWKYSIITPIHKNGNLHDPSNYRGIAVSDCISKVLNSIINDRIYNFLKTNRFWAPHQNGFMKKRRTEDNIFILHTLFQKYVRNKRQRLYVAFIDFSKYFDTINRSMLMYKLLKNNITGNIYKVIKHAYDNSYYSVKTGNGSTPYFKSNSGVKQGCNLSPTLSNIYQNDLHSIFDQTCDPVDLNGFSLNSLSWADDLVLISKSMEGLQACMGELNNYCNKWGLTLNVEKTKFMIMSTGIVRLNKKLLYNRECIEQVCTYKYLGLLLSSNGKFKNTILDRHSKAQKAFYQVKGALSTSHNVSHKVALSIFDKQISPILLYGSCIWGIKEAHMVKLKSHMTNLDNKASVRNICENVLKRKIEFDMVRSDKINNEVIIRVKNYLDKMNLIQQGHLTNNVCIEHFATGPKHQCEKLHTKFCKFVLGISKFSSDYAVLGELGRVPLYHKILLSHTMYWLNLEQGTENRFLNLAYSECKAGNHDFINSIQSILHSNGLGFILDNGRDISKETLKLLLSQRLKDQYLQDYESKIQQNFKDLTLCKLGEDYKVCNYLDIVQCPSIRNIITRLRINQSKLKGHIFGIPDNNCVQCGVYEDSKHMLFDCKNPALAGLRTKFVNSVSLYDAHFKCLSSSLKTKRILTMNFNSPVIINLACKFVSNMYNARFKPNHL